MRGALLVAALSGVAVAGCGGSSTTPSREPLRGVTLLLTPSTATAGTNLHVGILNETPLEVSIGADLRVEKEVDQGWVPAGKPLTGATSDGRIALSRPSVAPLPVREVRVPSHVAPGRYRVTVMASSEGNNPADDTRGFAVGEFDVVEGPPMKEIQRDTLGPLRVNSKGQAKK